MTAADPLLWHASGTTTVTAWIGGGLAINRWAVSCQRE
jgi:hypothetical protein